jgi:hypothetical protein
MTLPATLPPALLETILARLARLLLAGANGVETAARDAAMATLASYQPATATELRLAANIVSFSLHALEALSQAADPGQSLTKILRLRGSAVSLSRESHKAERRLEQLQQARHAGQPEPQTPEPVTPPTLPVTPPTLIEATRQTATPPIWSKAYRQQQAARRITENLKKNAAAANAAPPREIRP